VRTIHITKGEHHFIYRYPATAAGAKAVVDATRRQTGDPKLGFSVFDRCRVLFRLIHNAALDAAHGLPQAKKGS
jgi:hypothetical protein